MKKMWAVMLCAGFLIGCQSENSEYLVTAENISVDQTTAFEVFKSLTGHYNIISREGNQARVDYQTISKNSAVTETWYFPTDEGELIEMTVFHLDNGVLKATHYCASGIQSNMVLSPDSPSGRYKFSAVTTTNQATPDTAFNSGFAYEFEGDKIHRDEYWTKAGEISPSNLTLQKQ